jgi:hypothetical protein
VPLFLTLFQLSAYTNLSNDPTVKDDTSWRKNVYKFGSLSVSGEGWKDIKEIFSSVATSLSKIKLKSTVYVGNSGSISASKQIFFWSEVQEEL